MAMQRSARMLGEAKEGEEWKTSLKAIRHAIAVAEDGDSEALVGAMELSHRVLESTMAQAERVEMSEERRSMNRRLLQTQEISISKQIENAVAAGATAALQAQIDAVQVQVTLKETASKAALAKAKEAEIAMKKSRLTWEQSTKTLGAHLTQKKLGDLGTEIAEADGQYLVEVKAETSVAMKHAALVGEAQAAADLVQLKHKALATVIKAKEEFQAVMVANKKIATATMTKAAKKIKQGKELRKTQKKEVAAAKDASSQAVKKLKEAIAAASAAKEARRQALIVNGVDWNDADAIKAKKYNEAVAKMKAELAIEGKLSAAMGILQAKEDYATSQIGSLKKAIASTTAEADTAKQTADTTSAATKLAQDALDAEHKKMKDALAAKQAGLNLEEPNQTTSFKSALAAAAKHTATVVSDGNMRKKQTRLNAARAKTAELLKTWEGKLLTATQAASKMAGEAGAHSATVKGIEEKKTNLNDQYTQATKAAEAASAAVQAAALGADNISMAAKQAALALAQAKTNAEMAKIAGKESKEAQKAAAELSSMMAAAGISVGKEDGKLSAKAKADADKAKSAEQKAQLKAEEEAAKAAKAAAELAVVKGLQAEMAKMSHLTEAEWRKKLAVTISKHQMASATVASLTNKLRDARDAVEASSAVAAMLSAAAVANVDLVVSTKGLSVDKLKTGTIKATFIEGVATAVGAPVKSVSISNIRQGKNCLSALKTKTCTNFDIRFSMKNKEIADAVRLESQSKFSDALSENGLTQVLKRTFQSAGQYVMVHAGIKSSAITAPPKA
jgi:colicin import membrane protein